MAKMEIEGKSFEPKRENKKGVTYSWRLYPGKRIFIKEDLHGDKEDWYPTKVESGHEVVVGQGKLRTAKGGGKIGYGVINEVKGDSFFSEGILVSAGKEARIFFKKKHRFNQPRITNFPRIPKNK